MKALLYCIRFLYSSCLLSTVLPWLLLIYFFYYFPIIGIAVKPAKGKALLWPSVLDENLEQMDSRTTHEARPVIKGTKYAANSWIHLYDFSKSNLWGCTGTFD